MNRQHGILIRSDRQVVADVYAAIWNGQEIRKKLLLHNDEIIFRDLRNDSIVVEASSNVGGPLITRGKDGFQLFGERFYGNALIIADEDRLSPKISPEEIAHRIRFFRVGE